MKSAVVGLFLFSACGVAYDLGRYPDAGPLGGAGPGGQGGTPLPEADVAPAPPEEAIQGIPFPCERWGQGKPLGGINALMAMENVAFLLWTAPQQENAKKIELATEAIETYLPVIETSGDLYCAALHMLENNRAVLGVGSFYRKWLGLDIYPEKDKSLFPDYDADRLALMSRAALDFLVDVTLRGDRNFQRLWTSPRPLALSSAWHSTPEKGPSSLAPYAAGILAEPGVIALQGRATLSPSARGAWLVKEFMCSGYPLHPAGPPEPYQVEISGPLPGESYRHLYERLLDGVICTSCHDDLDGAGFALDQFDVVGRLAPTDIYGQAFDASGVLSYSYTGEFAPPADNPEGKLPFASLGELGQLLSRHIETQACYAQRWLEYSHAPEQASAEGISDKAKLLAETLMAHDGQIRFLIAAVLEARFGG